MDTDSEPGCSEAIQSPVEAPGAEFSIAGRDAGGFPVFCYSFFCCGDLGRTPSTFGIGHVRSFPSFSLKNVS
jgi:hypothetical protein